jgi:hypothetical protein
MWTVRIYLAESVVSPVSGKEYDRLQLLVCSTRPWLLLRGYQPGESPEPLACPDQVILWQPRTTMDCPGIGLIWMQPYGKGLKLWRDGSQPLGVSWAVVEGATPPPGYDCLLLPQHQ